MWDLTVTNVHDFAVGTGQFVVHNCTKGVDGHGEPGTDANEFEKRQGADLIKNTEKSDRDFSSSCQWDYKFAEGPDAAANDITHDARFSQRYYFKFMD